MEEEHHVRSPFIYHVPQGSFRSHGGLSRLQCALPIPLLCRAHADMPSYCCGSHERLKLEFLAETRLHFTTTPRTWLMTQASYLVLRREGTLKPER